MPKATYSIATQGASAAAANYPLAIIEAGPAKTFRLQRFVVNNPGYATIARNLTFAVVQQIAAGVGGTVTPNPIDTSDQPFSGIARAVGSTIAGSGTIIAFGEISVPAGTSQAVTAAPIVFNFEANQNEKPPTCYSAPPATTNTLSNGTWYMIATLGTTTNAQWLASGAANDTAAKKVCVGCIFQANAVALVGTGTVTPLVLATSMSVGTNYAIASLGTTTIAQWQAAGSPTYTAVGSVFKATAAAAGGTGLAVALTPGNCLAIVATNGGAGLGLGGLDYQIFITEG